MAAFLYDLIYSLPMCLTAVLLGHAYLGFEETTPLLCVFTVIADILCVVLYHLKAREKALLCGTLAMLFLGTFVVGKGDIIRQNGRLFWVLLICAVCFALEKVAGRYRKVKIALAAAGFTLLIVLMVLGYKNNKAVFLLILFYLLAFSVEMIQAGWHKEGHTETKKHLVQMLPFLIPVFIVLALIRMPDAPYDWKFFRNLLRDARTGYELLVQTLFPDQGWDGDANMGFSDKGVINGRVQSDPYRVLTITSDADHDNRLYLGGKTFDTFDGREWVKTDDSDLDYKEFDRLETAAAILRHDPDHLSDYIQNVRIHIAYKGIRTKHVFAPPKSVPDMLVDPMLQTGGDWILRSSARAEYTVKYYRLNRDHPVFKELLEDSRELSTEDWERAVQENQGLVREQYTADAYRRYRDHIHNLYLQPVQLSDRAQAFMEAELDGAQSDADKLSRIETMLSGYKYTRTPGELPERVRTPGEFIDYLLFEKPEGFCTHFATAFVLLARSQGIPARYVQGYAVLTDTRNFEVQSDRAHAWPEAYLEGVGWIGYEPTPGYKRPVIWAVSTGGYAPVNPEIYAPGPEQEQERQEEVKEPEEDVLQKIRWKWILMPLLFGVIFLCLFLLGDYCYRKNRYRHMNDRDKILTLCKRNMKLLKRAGYRRRREETLTEFAQRNRERIPEELLRFVTIYERALYAEDTSCEDDVKITEQLNRDCVRFVFSEIRRRIKAVFLKAKGDKKTVYDIIE